MDTSEKEHAATKRLFSPPRQLRERARERENRNSNTCPHNDMTPLKQNEKKYPPWNFLVSSHNKPNTESFTPPGSFATRLSLGFIQVRPIPQNIHTKHTNFRYTLFRMSKFNIANHARGRRPSDQEKPRRRGGNLSDHSVLLKYYLLPDMQCLRLFINAPLRGYLLVFMKKSPASQLMQIQDSKGRQTDSLL
jgi:hypothetical protein